MKFRPTYLLLLLLSMLLLACDGADKLCDPDAQAICIDKNLARSCSPEGSVVITVCKEREYCKTGQCLLKCEEGEFECGNNCLSEEKNNALSCVNDTTLTCKENYGDCDKNVANGCEAYLRNDEEHCGKCDNPCGERLTCLRGQCESID